MGNEAGQWIMYGVDWDDPECIHTVEEAAIYINEVGFQHFPDLLIRCNGIYLMYMVHDPVPGFLWILPVAGCHMIISVNMLYR